MNKTTSFLKERKQGYGVITVFFFSLLKENNLYLNAPAAIGVFDVLFNNI